jgi:putative transposase
LSSLLTTSNDEHIDNPCWYRNGQAKLRVLQRRVSRRKMGGNNRRKAVRSLQRHHQHIANQRKDFLNKTVCSLVEQNDLIAIEDLQIDNMVRNHKLSKSILDAGWGYFKSQLLSKAEYAGKIVVLVPPAYTSKTCSNCGALFENLTLADRWVTCGCGLSLDRDHNAAINILKRAGQVRSDKSTTTGLRLSEEAVGL